MNINELLEELKNKKIFLSVFNGKLKCKDECNNLNKELSNNIKKNKYQIIRLLSKYSKEYETVNKNTELKPSFAQERMWVLNNLEKNSSQYNISTEINLSGELDILLFENSLIKLIENNKILRTNYLNDNGQLKLNIKDSFTFQLEKKDIEFLPKKMKDKRLKELNNECLNSPFNLDKDLMLKGTLILTEKNKYTLFLTFHHIAIDGWSINLIQNEISKHYHSSESKTKSIFDYNDYSNWQSNWLKGDVKKSQLMYWEKELKEIPETHSIPFDKKREIEDSNNAKIKKIVLNNEEKNQLESFCKSNSVTKLHFIKSLFDIFIYKITNENDIVIGMPISGRNKIEFQDTIGLFVNSLPVRANIKEELTYKDYLSNVKNKIIEIMKNEDIPLESIVEKINPKRSNLYNPIFQLFISLDEEINNENKIGDILFKYIPSAINKSKFDLELNVLNKSDHIDFNFVYNESLFKEDTIEIFLNNFKSILFTVLNNESIKIKDIQLSTSDFTLPTLVNKIEYKNINDINKNDIVIKSNYSINREKYSDILQMFLKENIKQKEVLICSEGIIESFIFKESLDMLGIKNKYIELNDKKSYYLLKNNFENIFYDNDIIDIYNKCKINKSVVLKNNNTYNQQKYIRLENNKELILNNEYFENYINILNNFINMNKKININLLDFSFMEESMYIANKQKWVLNYNYNNTTEFYLKDLLMLDNCNITFIKKYNLITSLNKLGHEIANPKEQIFVISALSISPDEVLLIKKYFPNSVIINDFRIAEDNLSLYLNELNTNKVYYTDCNIKIINKHTQKQPLGSVGKLFYHDFDTDILSYIDYNMLIKKVDYIYNDDSIKSINKTIKNILKNEEFYIKNNNDHFLLYIYGEKNKFLDNSLFNTFEEEHYNHPKNIYFLENTSFNNGILDIENSKIIEQKTLSLDFNKIEEKIIVIWNSIIKEKVNINKETTFFDIGGNSLLAAKLKNEIQQNFGVELNYGLIFNEPTLSGISKNVFNTLISKITKDIIEKSPNPEIKIDFFMEEESLNYYINYLLNNLDIKTNLIKIEKVMQKDNYDLSKSQLQQVLEHELSGVENSKNIYGHISLKEEINSSKLQKVINILIKKHESLRVKIIKYKNNYKQVIMNENESELEVIKLEDDNLKIQKVLKELKNKNINLYSEKLFHFQLIKTPKENIISILIHHSICDAISTEIIIKDLENLYYEEKDLDLIEIQKEHITYKDFSNWQNNLTNDDNDYYDYWKNQLSTNEELIDIPFAKERGNTRDLTGSHLSKELPSDYLNKIDDFCSKNRITVFMFFNTIIKTLLYKYTNKKNIIVGTPSTGRTNLPVDDIVGCFINILPLYNKIEDNESFLSLLNKVKNTTNNSFEKEQYPFTEMVKNLNKRRFDRSAIFDVLMEVDLGIDDKHDVIYSGDQDNTYYDLSFVFFKKKNNLGINIIYSKVLFNEELINKIFEHLVNIIDITINDKEILLDNISIFTEEENKNKENIFISNKNKIDEKLNIKNSLNYYILNDKKELLPIGYKGNIYYKDSANNVDFIKTNEIGKININKEIEIIKKNDLINLSKNIILPRNDIEDKIFDIWTDKIDIVDFGVKDSFFDIGGTSFIAVDIVATMNEKGLNITIRDLIEKETIEKISIFIEESNNDKNEVNNYENNKQNIIEESQSKFDDLEDFEEFEI
jgi:hypothetical protein